MFGIKRERNAIGLDMSVAFVILQGGGEKILFFSNRNYERLMRLHWEKEPFRFIFTGSIHFKRCECKCGLRHKTKKSCNGLRRIEEWKIVSK